MFVLVRHAYAGDKRSWSRSDAKRPLTRAGREEAAGLAQTLSGVGIERLYSSPYLRCRQTLTPLAAANSLAVRESDLLLPSADPAALDKWLLASGREGAVLCTHGETLNALLRRWHRRGRIAGSEKPPDSIAKGAALVVTTGKKGLTLHYLRPVRIIGQQQPRPTKPSTPDEPSATMAAVG